MYNKIIKPLLFRLNIEQAHALVINMLRIVGMIPGGRKVLSSNYSLKDSSLERDVFGVKFKNPVGLAAGFDCNGDIVNEIAALGFGFVEVGTITPEAQGGTPRPRVFRLKRDKAILNRKGQANLGWRYAIENLRRDHSEIVVGCNIGLCNATPPQQSYTDYLKSFRTLYQYVDYFTVNITSDYCAAEPQSHSTESLMRVLEPLFQFRRGQSEYRPIMLKVSPDITDEVLDRVVDILIETPLDGIVAVSGSRSCKDLKTSRASLEQIGAGRISGEPLRARALEVVSHIHKRTNGAYPIIGVGGIMNADDAKAMLDAGASLIQLYTGYIYQGPSLVKEICHSLLENDK